VTERPIALGITIALPPVSVRECVMPQPDRFDPLERLPPSFRRRCWKCGLPMVLSLIEPTEDVDKESRTFECASCNYEETVTAKFR
jgi:hypothetical protein